ncbi:MAG: class I SAM-dependent methyltransferase [Planctomycetes bacterium]|nr:class I SAM-dependent methyltransferase [Planctomycetota bacterium]
MVESFDALLAALDAVPDVDSDRSPHDDMFDGDETAYLRGGRTALRCVKLALLAAGRRSPQRILDLPSGFGRVLRFLRAEWPEAEIVACDLQPGAVQWCAERYRAVPVVSVEEPRDVSLQGPFDLIWCGSLLTHLPVRRWSDWLERFETLLSSHGVLVFSVHGRLVEHYLRSGVDYSLGADGVAALLAGVDRDGFAYVDYPGWDGYGVSLSRADWVVRELLARNTLRLVSYAERALNRHQDVVVCEPIRR